MAHQILSFCVQKSGATFDNIQKSIIENAFKGGLLPDQTFALLSHFVEIGFLHQDSAATFSAGKKAEHLVEYYEFYSVFQTADQWTLLRDGQVIGQIPMVGHYKKGDHILLGSRVWLVIEISESAKRLIVTPAKRGRAPIFNASFGFTHRRIHQKMLEVYSSEDEYSFLNPVAVSLLKEGRQSFTSLVADLPSGFQIRHKIFEGTAIKNTVSCLLELSNIPHGLSECFLEINLPRNQWVEKLKAKLNEIEYDEDLAGRLGRERKLIEKYDRFLPENLLNQAYAKNYLDLIGTKKWLEAMG